MDAVSLAAASSSALHVVCAILPSGLVLNLDQG